MDDKLILDGLPHLAMKQVENVHEEALPGFQRMSFLAKDQCSQLWPHGSGAGPGFFLPGFSILSLMEPLRQALLVIPQIILDLCAISIVTFNKLLEIMTPFYGGNKTQPRINVTTNEKMFNWLFYNGAATTTCMNSNSFHQAFNCKRPKLLHKGTG
jgi:hypothetical protein